MQRYLAVPAIVLFSAAALLLSPRTSAAEDKWEKLGSRVVEFKGNHDDIHVGKSSGKFTHIRLKVEDGNLVMDKIIVTFEDNSTFEPKVRVEFKEGSRSRDIDLPRKGRFIKEVHFAYKSEQKEGKATVELYGKEK
jgi:hypothetical protein